MTSVEALCDCIMRFEGWQPPATIQNPRGSRSWRNRNPGNLRPISKEEPADANGYRIFNSLSDGFAALVQDVQAKLDGKSSHELTPECTLLDFFNVYAPSGDSNNPTQYSDVIAGWLSKIFNAQVMSKSTLEYISKLGS